MSWAKFTDNMPEDPDIARLTDGAFRLFVSATCWAAQHQTDGEIPNDMLRRIMPRFKASYASELVTAGVWTEDPHGYTIRSFLKYNPSREAVRARRTAAANRIQRWRAKQDQATT